MSPHAQVARVRPTTSTWGLIPALLTCLAAPAFFVLMVPWAGWMLLAAALVGAWLVDRRGGVSARPPTERAARRDGASSRVARSATGGGGSAGWAAGAPSLLRDLSLIAIGMLIVSAIPLKAELDDLAFVRFGLALGGAVVVPYLISRFLYRDHAIRFPWRGGGRWEWWQWVWLIAVIGLGWLILPFYFITSGVYTNWPIVDTPDMIARLFVGVGAVGIWDELFFICTVFVLLLRHFPVWQANLLQTVVFVSFLWELGYQAWGPLLTIPFAIVQGFLFLRTQSLWYVVVVHLLFDAVVFGVLVHAHNPGLVPIFLVPAP